MESRLEKRDKLKNWSLACVVMFVTHCALFLIQTIAEATAKPQFGGRFPIYLGISAWVITVFLVAITVQKIRVNPQTGWNALRAVRTALLLVTVLHFLNFLFLEAMVHEHFYGMANGLTRPEKNYYEFSIHWGVVLGWAIAVFAIFLLLGDWKQKRNILPEVLCILVGIGIVSWIEIPWTFN